MKTKLVISDDDNISFRFAEYRKKGEDLNCELLVPQRYGSFSDISSILKDMLVLVTDRNSKALIGELENYLRIFRSERELPDTVLIIVDVKDKKKAKIFEDEIRTKLKESSLKGCTVVCRKKL